MHTHTHILEEGLVGHAVLDGEVGFQAGHHGLLVEDQQVEGLALVEHVPQYSHWCRETEHQ